MFRKIIENVISTGRKLRSCYKHLTSNTWSDTEEENRHYHIAVRMLYWSFYSCGGFYIAEGLSKQTKCIIAAVNTTAYMALAGSGAIYYAWGILNGTTKFDPLEIFNFLVIEMGFLSFFFTTPALVLYFRREIWETLQFVADFKTTLSTINLELGNRPLDGCDQADASVHDTTHKRANLLLHPLVVYILEITLICLFASGAAINYLLFYMDTRSPTISDYTVVPIFYDLIKSAQAYFLATGPVLIVTIIVTVSHMAFCPFIELLGGILYDNAFDICKLMGTMSHNYTVLLKNILSHAEKTGEDQSAARASLVTAFNKDLITIIKEYNKCNECIKTIQPFLKFFLSTLSLFIYFGLLATAGVLMTGRLNSYQKFNFASVYLAIVILLYAICNTGRRFNDLAELYQYTVYNIQWYDLPPRTRKTIHLFQTEVLLNEKIFYVLAIYPINLAMLPTALQSAYSYANVLRVAKLRRS